MQLDGAPDSLAEAMSSPPAPRAAAALAGVAIALAATLCAWLSGGYFLADDFVQLASFGHWDASGRLASEVAGKFHASIDGVNAFCRPLTFLTYALNYVLGNGNARGWLAVNLALHLANAALVGWLVARLACERSSAALGGALVAGIRYRSRRGQSKREPESRRR